jgi:site-specific recombinase XerD
MSVNTIPQDYHNSKLTITQALDWYLLLRYSLSNKTRQIYGQHITRLAVALGNPALEDITPDDLARFFSNLRRADGNEYSPGYVHQIWRTLNTFFNFHRHNPLQSLEKPTLPIGPKPRLSLLEIDKILRAIDEADTRRYDLRRRNLAIVLLMVDSGIRLNEIITIDLNDLDLEAREITVHDQKTNKTRVVPISRATQNALATYLDERPDNSSRRLFLNADQTDLTKGAVSQMVKRLKIRAGIDCLHPHLFRHTFARHYINRGELQKLSQILGHSDVRTTANYAAADLDAIKAEFELACPTAQLEQAGGGQNND